MDFGTGFDPTGVPDTHDALDTHDAPEAVNHHDDGGCCAGANRAHRRAHRRGRSRSRPPTARAGVTVSLIVDWDLLRAGLAGGSLPDGTVLSLAATLTALCDAGIIPMVFTAAIDPEQQPRQHLRFATAT